MCIGREGYVNVSHRHTAEKKDFLISAHAHAPKSLVKKMVAKLLIVPRCTSIITRDFRKNAQSKSIKRNFLFSWINEAKEKCSSEVFIRLTQLDEMQLFNAIRGGL